jgi:hypothetical protein
VATPDLASLRNAKNMIDLIKQGRPNDAPPRLVLNQVGVPGRPEIPAKDFGAALGIHPSLIMPFDPKPFGAGRQQRPDDPRRRRQVQGRRGLPDPGPDRDRSRSPVPRPRAPTSGRKSSRSPACSRRSPEGVRQAHRSARSARTAPRWRRPAPAPAGPSRLPAPQGVQTQAFAFGGAPWMSRGAATTAAPPPPPAVARRRPPRRPLAAQARRGSGAQGLGRSRPQGDPRLRTAEEGPGRSPRSSASRATTITPPRPRSSTP